MEPIKELQKIYIELVAADDAGDHRTVSDRIGALGYWIDRLSRKGDQHE